MKKWRYLVVQDMDCHKLVERLNEFGVIGWELMHVDLQRYPDPQSPGEVLCYTAFLKCEIIPEWR